MFKEIARRTGLKEGQVKVVIEEFLLFSTHQARKLGQFSLEGYISFYVTKLPPGYRRLPDGRLVWGPERETLQIKPLKRLKKEFSGKDRDKEGKDEK